MHGTRRALWLGVAAGAAIWPALVGTGVARANGIGDLYVGTPKTVLEVAVAPRQIVNTVAIPRAARSLAFSPDGRSLFVSTGQPEIVAIDIGTITVTGNITVAGPAAAIAHPAGERLAVALPDLSRVALIDDAGGAPTNVALEDKVDLLAGDRRMTTLLAAAAGGHAVFAIDAALGTSRTFTVEGAVVGLAVDRDTGGAFVATRAPNAVLRVDLDSLKVAWTVALKAAPISVTQSDAGAMVGLSDAIVGAAASGTFPVASLTSAPIALAGSDDGKIVVAAMSDRILAYASSGAPMRTIPLPAGASPAAIATIPKPMVVGPAGGSAGGPVASGAGRASPAAGRGNGTVARSTHAPTTSTDPLAAVGAMGGAPLIGAIAVAVAILAAWWGTSLARERARRRPGGG